LRNIDRIALVRLPTGGFQVSMVNGQMVSLLENDARRAPQHGGASSTFEVVDLTKGPADGMRRDIRKILEIAGLRPTRQRLELGSLLFSAASRHLTAEMLYEEATLAKIKVSLATVYNTLNHLTHAGLLRRIRIDGTKTYYDANLTPHQHYYLENVHELVDMPDLHCVQPKMLDLLEGHEISRIGVIVRPRLKR
jgi:Fur family iron response transcriptional regulator